MHLHLELPLPAFKDREIRVHSLVLAVCMFVNAYLSEQLLFLPCKDKEISVYVC